MSPIIGMITLLLHCVINAQFVPGSLDRQKVILPLCKDIPINYGLYLSNKGCYSWFWTRNIYFVQTKYNTTKYTENVTLTVSQGETFKEVVLNFYPVATVFMDQMLKYSGNWNKVHNQTSSLGAIDFYAAELELPSLFEDLHKHELIRITTILEKEGCLRIYLEIDIDKSIIDGNYCSMTIISDFINLINQNHEVNIDIVDEGKEAEKIATPLKIFSWEPSWFAYISFYLLLFWFILNLTPILFEKIKKLLKMFKQDESEDDESGEIFFTPEDILYRDTDHSERLVASASRTRGRAGSVRY